MAFRKSIKKLDDYYGLLDDGQARSIKRSEVKKIVTKLNARKQRIVEELERSRKASRKEALARKLMIAEEQLTRADWLLKKLRTLKTR